MLRPLDTFALFSVRYALPRNTSADFAVTSSLTQMWDQLSAGVQKQIIEEITSEKDLYGYDAWLWNKFLEEHKDTHDQMD